MEIGLDYLPKYTVIIIIIIGRKKGKATLLQAWAGPEGSRNLRLPDFKTIGS
jgi:hypothetical protein